MYGRIQVGSDPELFLKTPEGKVVSAIGKIGGTKKKPKPIKELGRGFAIQEDNVLVEYNTPPVRNVDSWVHAHQKMLNFLKEKVGQLGLQLDCSASHIMDEDEMDHPRAWVFGCEPDFDVWKLEMNPKPMAQNKFLRSAGGHIHVGYYDPTPAKSIKLVRALDMMVGATMAELDPDTQRRELYGKAGACRFKPYGVEYRTPSNFWLSTPELTEKVYMLVQYAVDYIEDIPDELTKEASNFINGDTDKKNWKEWISQVTENKPRLRPYEFLANIGMVPV